MINNSSKRRYSTVITMLALFVALLTSVNTFNSNVNAELGEADAIACKYEDGSFLANMASTDHRNYMTRSKSAMTTTQSVNSSLMNKLLTIAGYDFNTPNEAVLGREIRPSSLPEEPNTEANDNAPKVSAFDRFGMAGMKWSSYQGEWKYNHVDVCANQNVISPTTYGTFYEDRLEPKSTWNEIATSKDARTVQHNRGMWNLIFTGFSDVVSNFLFSFTKLIVTLTIVFVGISFSDVTTLIGMTADGSAGPSAAGMFTDIFNTMFSGFIVLSFVITGAYLIYKGMIKREVRYSLNSLLKTIAIFFIATIMASNPSYWVSLPNRVATFGQALALNSVAGLYENDVDSPTLCSTDVSSVYEGIDNVSISDEGARMSEFEKINNNMRSIIGCQMWETLVFRPWVRGQFGADYDDLFDENLDNINKDWVGNGSVPVGNGQTIDNWALFHLSTQTDAHAQVGGSNFPTLVNGVNADWWRTGDALSNYDEEEVTDSLGEGSDPQTFTDQVKSDPTEYWQSWIGNDRSERTTTALMSIFFGIMGSIAPLTFAISTTVFGLGITILMIVSPVFMLLGTWGGIGDGIFKGWLSSLANTIIKRIGTSVLLVLSISITMSIMNLVYTVGFMKSFLLMMVVSSILIKNKNTILDKMATVDFGGTFDPRTKAKQITNAGKSIAGGTGRIATTTAVGANQGRKTGQGMIEGAKIGASREIRNKLFQSQLGMNITMEIDSARSGSKSEIVNCTICFAMIGVDGERKQSEETAYRDEYGNYYCSNCAEELGLEELYSVTVGLNDNSNIVTPSDTRSLDNSTANRSYLSHEAAKEEMGSAVINGKYYWDNDGVKNMATDNINKLNEDMAIFRGVSLVVRQKAQPPALPEPLHEYIDLSLINKAWTEGRLDIVEDTYKEAWGMWYEDNAKHVEGVSQDDIDNFKNTLLNHEAEVDEVKTNKMIQTKTKAVESNKATDTDYKKSLYAYRNGVLSFNRIDREDKEDSKEKHSKNRVSDEDIEEMLPSFEVGADPIKSLKRKDKDYYGKEIDFVDNFESKDGVDINPETQESLNNLVKELDSDGMIDFSFVGQEELEDITFEDITNFTKEDFDKRKEEYSDKSKDEDNS